MKPPVPILLLLFASCTSTRKTVTTAVKITDTTSVTRAVVSFDTSSLTTVKRAQDVDVTYYYDTTGDDDTRDTPPTQPFHFIVNHSKLVAVNVHIGSVSDSSVAQSSASLKDTSTRQSAYVQTIAQTSVTTKTSLPWWIYVAGGLLGLLLLLFIAYKIYKAL